MSINHLIGMKELEKPQIEALLKRANDWANRPHEQDDLLNGRFVANLFFEPSTRTRCSFEVAEKRLGAQVLNFAAENSSTTKGETVYDTLRTLESMGVEAAVIRTSENNLLQELANRVKLRLINAGDGTNEHPTQCLLDLLTMKRHFGKIEGLKVAVIGDLRHSRVLGSHLHALPKLGAELILSGPPGMMRAQEEVPFNVKTVEIEEAIETADVVMMLRVQLERHQQVLFDTKEMYHEAFGLTLDRAKRMKKEAVIMHPAPVNRGVEIDTSLVEGGQSLIFTQIKNGVPVRMAVLESLLMGGGKKWASSLQTASY